MLPDSNKSGRSITINWWPGISKKYNIYRCYTCVLHLTENLKQTAVCTQMSVWSMLHFAGDNQNGYSLPQNFTVCLNRTWGLTTVSTKVWHWNISWVKSSHSFSLVPVLSSLLHLNLTDMFPQHFLSRCKTHILVSPICASYYPCYPVYTSSTTILGKYCKLWSF